MADQSLIERLKQGVTIWNEWKAKQPTTPLLDLTGADFSTMSVQLNGVDLSFCNLRGGNLSCLQATHGLFYSADLQGANLSRAKLNGANFTQADLSFAILAGAILLEANFGVARLTATNLSGACLVGAYFGVATLDRANLAGADLSGANFSQASLKETDFGACDLGLTVFGDVDLSEAKGLDQIRDHAMVILDIRSIYQSNGNIPESFLRAAGFPDAFLALIPTLDFEEEMDEAQGNEREPTEEDRKLPS